MGVRDKPPPPFTLSAHATVDVAELALYQVLKGLAGATGG
jgi:hypothetical protein